MPLEATDQDQLDLAPAEAEEAPEQEKRGLLSSIPRNAIAVSALITRRCSGCAR